MAAPHAFFPREEPMTHRPTVMFPAVTAAVLLAATFAVHVPAALAQEILQPPAAQATPPVTQNATPAVAPAAAAANPLMVTGVIIDKTAANAVLAREEAMSDARRAAFRKLAQRHLSAEAAADLPMPDDDTLGALVQDMEIKRERLSATRYVGDFTVRFSESVRQFIPVAVPEPEVAAVDSAADDMAATGIAAAVAPGDVRLTAPVLVLPYVQNMAGQMVLWGEPNAWRKVWQTDPPRARGLVPEDQVAKAEGKVIVPLGDISDISAGADSAVWSGNYAALDKLRENYGVRTVMLAVANRSGAQMRVDLYDYSGDSLVRRAQLQPIIDPALDEHAAFAMAAREALRAILTAPPSVSSAMTAAGFAVNAQTREEALASISRDLTAGAAPAVVQPQPVVVPPVAGMPARGTQVQAGMRFADFTTWMETQRRLASIVPSVRVNIQTISRDQARFTLGFDGDMQVLHALLAERGMQLTQTAGTDYQLVLTQ